MIWHYKDTAVLERGLQGCEQDTYVYQPSSVHVVASLVVRRLPVFVIMQSNVLRVSFISSGETDVQHTIVVPGIRQRLTHFLQVQVW